jgi:hypothetical protein
VFGPLTTIDKSIASVRLTIPKLSKPVGASAFLILERAVSSSATTPDRRSMIFVPRCVGSFRVSRILTCLKAIVQQPVAQTPCQDMPQQTLACIHCAKDGSKATVTKHFGAIENGKKVGLVIFPIGALVLYTLVVG